MRYSRTCIVYVWEFKTTLLNSAVLPVQRILLYVRADSEKQGRSKAYSYSSSSGIYTMHVVTHKSSPKFVQPNYPSLVVSTTQVVSTIQNSTDLFGLMRTMLTVHGRNGLPRSITINFSRSIAFLT